MTGVVLKSLNGLESEQPTLIECNNMPPDKQEIPTPEMARRFPHLNDIPSEIPQLDGNAHHQRSNRSCHRDSSNVSHRRPKRLVVPNSVEVMEAFPVEDRGKEVRDLELRLDSLPTQHSLGVYWNLE